MSNTDPRGFANDNAFDDTTYVDAMAIAGCIMAGLIALVVLRFCVNLLIDLVILGDMNSAQRAIGNFVRLICPWWHRRTQPAGMPTTTATNQGRQQQGGADIEMNNVLGRHSLLERKAIIGSILVSKTLTKEDLGKLRSESSESSGEEGCSTSGKSICSICLLEFEVGDHAVTAERCSHTYHPNCIIEWLASRGHGADCPYCRTPMISVDSLQAASLRYHHNS